jgi:type I restriction enzyme S subunit
VIATGLPSTVLDPLVEEVQSWDPASAPEIEFTYIDIASVDAELKRIVAPKRVRGVDAPSRARQLVRAGDVLVSTVRPNLNAVAHVPAELDGATASTGFCVLRAKQRNLNDRYLYHWVRSPGFVRSMVRLATGASYPAVSDRIVRESALPLPPTGEQKRIAAILDKADAVRSKRREAVQMSRLLQTSIFRDFLGDPSQNPRNWPVHRLGDVIRFVGGSQPPKDTFINEPRAGYVRLVQIRDFKSDRYPTYVPRDMCRRFFEADDVMIARYGPPVFQILRGLSGAYNVALMKAEPTSEATKTFIFYLLQIPEVHDVVVENSSRTAGQSGVNLELLEAIRMPIPPVAEQNRISKVVSKIELLEMSNLNFERQSQDLSNALVQRAFRGEL